MPLVLLVHSVPCSHCPYWPCHHIVIVIFIHQGIQVCMQKLSFYSSIVISLEWLKTLSLSFPSISIFACPFLHSTIMRLESDTYVPQNLFWICTSWTILIVQYFFFYRKHIIIHITTHFNDKDERKVLVEGCEHRRNAGWVIIGVTGMRHIIKNIKGLFWPFDTK